MKAVFILGPTASGKTRLGVDVARAFGGEIISADSRQVYKGMNIGTGKDLEEYGFGKDKVPCHLIDVAEPSEEFNLYRFLVLFRDIVDDLRRRGRLPVIVGGSPLYLKAVLENYRMPGGAADPELRKQWGGLSDEQLCRELRQKSPDLYVRTDKTQRRRVLRALEIACTVEADSKSTSPERLWTDLEPLLIAPYHSRQEMHRRIEKRLDERLRQGLLEEVERLHDDWGLSWEKLERFGLEYRLAAEHLQGKMDFAEFRQQLLARIRGFCKSQDGWYRKFERDGWDIHWIPGGQTEQAIELTRSFLNGRSMPKPEIRLCEILYGPRS